MYAETAQSIVTAFSIGANRFCPNQMSGLAA